MKILKLFILLSCIAFLFSCSNDDDPDIPQLTKLSTTPIPGNATMDVWSYVDPSSGIEYAIIGDFTDLQAGHLAIIDVSDSINPDIVATMDAVIGFDMKVWENYIYVANGGGNGNVIDTVSRIIDISDPSNPVIAGSFQRAHNIFIDNQGFLYLAGGHPGVRIFNLNTDPENPQLVWQDETNAGSHDISVIRNRLYDFHGGNGTLIYDVADPANPQLLGTVPYQGFNHSGWVTEDDRFLFIGDEVAPDGQPDFIIYDITNPANAVQVGGIFDQNSRGHNVYIKDNLAYLSYYSAGLKIYDVSDPTQPMLLDEAVTKCDGCTGLGSGFDGAFGVYPFTTNGVIFVSDMDEGLVLFKFD